MKDKMENKKGIRFAKLFPMKIVPIFMEIDIFFQIAEFLLAYASCIPIGVNQMSVDGCPVVT